MSEQLSLFDYDSLNCEDRIVIKQKTDEIKVLMRRTAQDVFDIGGKLLEIKDRLGHGKFGHWLKSEFGWSDRTAQNFMLVHSKFKAANISDFSYLNISPSALYVLAADIPEAAREEAIALSQEKTIAVAEVKAIVKKHKKEPCLPNSISVLATAADFPSLDSEAEKSDLSQPPKSIPKQESLLPNDFPTQKRSEISINSSGINGDSDPTLSPPLPPANPSAYRETEKEPTILETAYPESSKSLNSSSPATLPLKTCEDFSPLPSDQEKKTEHISEKSSNDWTPAGSMHSGQLYPQPLSVHPSKEKDCYLLPSPGALSAPAGTRSPGQSKLEAWLKEAGILSKSQVLNPEILEKAFNLPLGWTDPSESRPATELLANVGPDWGIVLTQESQGVPSSESSGSTSFSFKQGDKVKTSVPGLIGEVLSASGDFASVLWNSGETTNIALRDLEKITSEFQTGDRVKILGEILAIRGEQAIVRWDDGLTLRYPLSSLLPQ